MRPPVAGDEASRRIGSTAQTPPGSRPRMLAAQTLRRRGRRGLTEMPAAALWQPQALAHFGQVTG
jgi:hypothetical protein